MQWVRLPESKYLVDPTLKGPEVAEFQVIPNWNEIDKEIEDCLDDTDDDNASGIEEDAKSEQSESNVDNHGEKAASLSDDGWLDDLLEDELGDSDPSTNIEYVGTRKRKHKDSDI